MKKFALILALLVNVNFLLAQTTISGRIVDDEGAAVVGAAIFIQSTRQGIASDSEGNFEIQYNGDFPTELTAKSLGYADATIELKNSQTAKNLTITLIRKSEEVDEVDVVGNRKSSNFESIDARAAITAVGVDGGIESVVKSQMGVSSNSELSSQYRVRGGNFDENMVYVNNIEIYRPFLIRSGEQEGLSFVNPDLVESIEFSSGCFDASYGDRMSSVLDVRYKTPSEVQGSARVSLLGASAHFGGATKSGAFSQITGIRYKTNRYMLGSMDMSGDYDPSFFDVQSFWIFRPSKKWRVDLLGYYARNRYQFEPVDRETTFGTISDAKTLTIYFEGNEDDYYQTGVVAATSTFRPNDRNSFALALSMYRSSEQENYDILGEYWLQQADASSSETSVDESENIGVGGYMEHARNELLGQIYTAAVRASHRLGRHCIDWEAKIQSENFDDYVNEWEYLDSAGYISTVSDAIVLSRTCFGDNEISQTRSSLFAKDAFAFDLGNGRMTVDYGVRFSYLSSNEEFLVSPRASVRYALSRWIFRAAAGRYSQSPFFRELRRSDGSLNRDVEAQHSWQFLLGSDLYFTVSERPFKFTTEVYYKYLTDLNPYSIDNVRIRYMADNCADGYAAGIDFKINGELVDGVESWACFSLMKTEEDIDDDGHGKIPRPSDQRVSFSMFFQDHMPSNRSVGLTLGMYLATGLPFGPPNSERYMATNRMPGYKRVDLGLFKDFAKNADGTEKWNGVRTFQIGLEVLNLFDFSNTISYFWVSDVENRQYAVPNYLTSRRLNVKISIEF